MKKILTLLSLVILLSLTSCVTAKLSDEPMVVEETFKVSRPYYYKYFYHCRQNNVKVRVYSNNVYNVGQTIQIK